MFDLKYTKFPEIVYFPLFERKFATTSNKIPKIEIMNNAYKNQSPPFGLFLPIKTSTTRVEY